MINFGDFADFMKEFTPDDRFHERASALCQKFRFGIRNEQRTGANSVEREYNAAVTLLMLEKYHEWLRRTTNSD